MMNWVVIGLVYAGAYAALMTALADQPSMRLIVGNAALMLPPLAPLAVLARRRRAWRGRQSVFWWTIGAWAALWLFGQVFWASDELMRATPQSWFRWPIIVQLCASALPLIALVAWPHRAASDDTAITVALDIAVLLFLTGFLYWSLIIAPGMHAEHAALALRSLATIGPLVRLAAMIGLLCASISAGKSAWAPVYRGMAAGMALAFASLIVLSWATVRGDYQTGSPSDIGWMLPFFFAAWAASAAPATPPAVRGFAGAGRPQSSPMLLFLALLAVPIVGYGSVSVLSLGPEIDRMREVATAFTLVCGIGLIMLRLRVERAASEQAGQRARLLATACEQAGELIVIVERSGRIEYANDAFCRATGYVPEELLALPPASLVAEESKGSIPAFNESIRARKIVRINLAIARRDGSTFQAATAAAPIVDASGRVTHFVSVIRDVTEELRLREQLVRSERLSAIGGFVSGVALEINNPLQSMIGTLELALADPHAAALRADLERMRFDAGRTVRIVRNLLTFVQQAPTERVLIDLNDVVKATTAVRAYELDLAGIELREDYAAMMPLVLANRDEIQQVLLSLIVNAQQAMADGAGTRVLRVRTHMIDADAVVDVHDTGPGIPDAIAGKIFEPFFSTRRAGSGPGLGLSLALGIAHAHRGTLDLVPSTVGTCFRLTLPGAGFPGPALPHTPARAAFGG